MIAHLTTHSVRLLCWQLSVERLPRGRVGLVLWYVWLAKSVGGRAWDWRARVWWLRRGQRREVA